MKSLYLSDIVSFVPENPSEAPKLEFTDPLFRRRLSQISKMTVQVVHDLVEKNPVDDDTKLVFVSLRGEIKREFTINELLIEDGSILPASFSLSVFNTPVALATLALKLHGGYSVIYPSKNDFSDAFKMAVSPVLAGTEKEIILVYADELVPEEYGDKRPSENVPLAFACRVSLEKKDNSVLLEDLDGVSSSPVEFHKFLTM